MNEPPISPSNIAMQHRIDFRLIRQLWMFLAVAEEQHFGRAAQRLNMAQPALSEQIKVLEQSLKLKLFDRSRQGTQLSPTGAAILPAVRQFAAQVERLERAVREVVSGQTGVLHIGAINSAMLETIPPLLEGLKKSHPHLTVFVKEIDSVEAIPALESGELDMAFARLDGQLGKGISTLPLQEDRLSVALNKSHPLASQTRIDLKSLSDEQLVMSSRQVSPVYFDMLISLCRTHGFAPRVTHEVRSVTSQIAYVSCGQGIALVPNAVRRLAPENVVVRPLKEKFMVVTSAAAWNSKRQHPMVDAAVTWLKSQTQNANRATTKQEVGR